MASDAPRQPTRTPAPNAHFIYADDDPGRIEVTCGVCSDGIDAPNQGLGRAMVATWKTQHQHMEVRRHQPESAGGTGNVPTE